MNKHNEPASRSELARGIIAAIRTEGRPGRRTDTGGAVRGISFRDYMAACLYDERFGYYRSGRARVGKAGDFYTSASIGPVMGETLAACLLNDIFADGVPPVVYEWGAGTGELGMQLIRSLLDREPSLSGALDYRMVDIDPAHLAAAQAALHDAGLAAACLTPDEAEAELAAEPSLRRIVVANELLDAFPVHRVVRAGGELWELGTAYDEAADAFVDCRLPLADGPVREALAADAASLADGQEAEVGVDAGRWLQRLCRLLPGGAIVLIDYGDEAGELYAAHRMQGTLMAYRRHAASTDPYCQPGEQDLTAHVNFTAVRRIAEAEGWRIAFYGTQKRFLVDNGALELLQDHRDPNPFGEAARRNRSIRQLLLSDGMSELFKVAVLRK